MDDVPEDLPLEHHADFSGPVGPRDRHTRDADAGRQEGEEWAAGFVVGPVSPVAHHRIRAHGGRERGEGSREHRGVFLEGVCREGRERLVHHRSAHVRDETARLDPEVARVLFYNGVAAFEPPSDNDGVARLALSGYEVDPGVFGEPDVDIDPMDVRRPGRAEKRLDVVGERRDDRLQRVAERLRAPLPASGQRR